MYMHKTIVKDNNTGTIQESVLFSEISARELKSSGALKNAGISVIIDTERATHPSPAAMIYGLKAQNVDITKFYKDCYDRQTAIAAEKAAKENNA